MVSEKVDKHGTEVKDFELQIPVLVQAFDTHAALDWGSSNNAITTTEIQLNQDFTPMHERRRLLDAIWKQTI